MKENNCRRRKVNTEELEHFAASHSAKAASFIGNLVKSTESSFITVRIEPLSIAHVGWAGRLTWIAVKPFSILLDLLRIRYAF